MQSPHELMKTIEEHQEPFSAFMLSRVKISALFIMIQDLTKMTEEMLADDHDEAASFMEATAWEPEELEFITGVMIAQAFNEAFTPCKPDCEFCKVVTKVRKGLAEWQLDTAKTVDDHNVEEMLSGIELED